jgi:tetratricopeptide (TPR) repeat protein
MENVKPVPFKICEKFCVKFFRCFSFWIGIDNYVKKCEIEELNILYELNLFKLIESWMYNPNAITQLSKIFSILKNIISKDKIGLKMLINDFPNIIELSKVYLHFRVGIVQTNTIKFYEELSKHKETCQIISELKDECVFELLDDYNDEIYALGKSMWVNFHKFGLRKKNFDEIKNHLKLRGGKFPNFNKANEFKDKGNELFKKEKFKEAIEHYDQGIEQLRYFGGNSCLHLLYGNRSECNLRLKNYQQAVIDSLYSFTSRGTSVDIKDSFEIKVFMRLAKSLIEIDKYLESTRCYYEILYDHPNSKEIVQLIKDIKLKVRKVNICTFCKKFQYKMMKCSICYEPYCSKDCQNSDWNQHKKVCQK